MRATLCAFFAVGGVISLAALAVAGIFSVGQLWLGIELMPGVAVGLALAAPLARGINHRRARAAVLTISSLSALTLLLR